MNALFLRDKEVYGAQLERVKQSDINLVVFPVDCAVARHKLVARRRLNPAQRLKFPHFAPRDGSALGVSIAIDVSEGAFVNEHSDFYAARTAEENAQRSARPPCGLRAQ